MKRALVSLLAAAVFAVGVVAPVAASPTSPSLSLAACYDVTWSQLKVTVTWANQTPGAGDLFVTITFKGKKLANTLGPLDYLAPVQPSAFSPLLISQFPGTNPNSWTSIDASATGAFVDEARAIRQPHGGWATC